MEQGTQQRITYRVMVALMLLLLGTLGLSVLAFVAMLVVGPGEMFLGLSALTGIDVGIAIISAMALSLLMLMAALTLVFLGWKEIYSARGRLAKEFGAEYQTYRQRVPMFLPRLVRRGAQSE